MKTYFMLILAAGLMSLAFCSKKDSLLNFKLNTPFTLGYQELAVWEDNAEVKIQFNRVLGDSRCPTDVECVWAGRVEVEITFTEGDSEQTTVVISGDPSGSGYSDTATFGNFTVKLLQVKPLPIADVVIPQESYTIELEVHKTP